MFSSVTNMLKGTSQKRFDNPKSWHNMFRVHVLEVIDEELFTPLFDDNTGAPNAPVKILMGMMILKEAFGWSDSDLFEQCRYNLLVRSALGLHNITDSLPVESTYYLFRKRIYDYHTERGIDLIETVFQQVTGSQVMQFKVTGGSIRMDSKLIGSNIAFASQYEIVHDALVLFYKEMVKNQVIKVSKKILTQLKALSEESSNNVVYKSEKDVIQDRLGQLGILCYKLLKAYKEKDNKHYYLLKRVFEENYNRKDGGVILIKSAKETKASKVQSVHDPECSYRKKGSQHVNGYSLNATETCDKNSLNLITDIQVAPASKPDNAFLKQAVESTKDVLNNNPDNLHADGAYYSPDNINFCDREKITYYFSALAGSPGRYELEIINGKYNVIDTETGQQIPVFKNKSGRWRIKTESRYRYFTDHDFVTSMLRKKIKEVPDEIRNKRNNVEATIFQLSYHTRNNKTRYRGLLKNKSWAILRGMWVNLRRIDSYLEDKCANACSINQIFPHIKENELLNEIKNFLTRPYYYFEYLICIKANIT